MFNVTCKLCKKMITKKSQEKTGGGGIITVAQMVADNVFCYGLSGLYEFSPPLAVKKGDSMCNVCLGEHKFVPYNNIKCSVCGKMHQGCWEEDSKQGWGCAGSVSVEKGKKYISCGWGSKFDTLSFSVKKSAQLKLRQVVCDQCIRGLLKKSHIKERGSSFLEG